MSIIRWAFLSHTAFARFFAIAFSCVALVVLPVPETNAQSNYFMIDLSNPQREYPIGTASPIQCPVRLSMRLSHASLGSRCYQPISFQVRPAAGRTFPKDGVVTVRYTASVYSGDEQVVIFNIPVSAGTAFAEAEMLVRTGPTTSNVSIDGAWNGRYYSNLSANTYTSFSGVAHGHIRVHLVSADTVAKNRGDLRLAFDSIADRETRLAMVNGPDQAMRTTAMNSSSSFVDCVADVARMPDNWLHFAHVEEISTTLEDLKKLDGAGRDIVSHYVWCGGRLRVTDAQRPSDLDGLITADWNHNRKIEKSLDQIYRAGFGDVVLGDHSLQIDSPWTSETHARLDRLSASIGARYWNWLIPQVGKTPIWAFLAMVTLLVGIGAPAILLWGQKIKRRIWTILAIPVLSLSSVLALFLYATVKDGWRSLVRIRSITILDENGNGAVWSRQNYFAGSIPGGKVVISNQAELIPLRTKKRIRTVQYQDDTNEKQIHSGILTLRQQKQVSITHWVSDLKILSMEGKADPETGMPVATNASESTIEALVCSDATGRTFRAEKVLPGQTVTWQTIEPEQASQWLKALYESQPLRLPPDAPSEDSVSILDSLRFVPSWGSTVATGSEHDDETTWVEELSDWGAETPYKFAAVVDRAPRLEKCLENVVETNSLHMVVGTWRPPGQNRANPKLPTPDSKGKGLQQEGFDEE